MDRPRPEGTIMPTTTPTVLLTGGTGFIGAHTAKVLVEDGAEVIATDISTDTRRLAKLDVLEDITVRQLDLTDPTAVIRTIRRTDATHVIHLGATTSLIARQSPRLAIEVNVTGTNNILEAARTLEDQVERVAWASTMAVYAPAMKYDRQPVDEDDLVYPDSIYGATKECCEHQARLYAEEFGVSAVGLRPTGVYGPFNNPDYLDSEGGTVTDHRSPSGRTAGLFAKAAQGHPVSMTVRSGANDWIYVEDVARLFVAAAFTPDEERSRHVYNAASGSVASIEEAVEILRDLLPDAEIDLTVEGESPYVSAVDGTRAHEEFDTEPQYDLRAGIEAYVNTIRADQGLDPV
ncbi:MAG: NAD-dependent epimerase/dehydratase family protein [Halobacteriales archaeon]